LHKSIFLYNNYVKKKHLSGYQPQAGGRKDFLNNPSRTSRG
jgi:hypothetical protein